MWNSSSPDNVSAQPEHLECLSVSDNKALYYNFLIIRSILLIPLSVLVLYLGFQQRSSRATSHFDIFTFHQSVMELMWALGELLFKLGVSFNLPHLVKMGYFFKCTIFFGETVFHILTCLERYLAVVHPVTYRGLQNSRGVAIRNAGAAAAWLVAWMWSCVLIADYNTLPAVPFLCFLVTSVVVVSFCSLCVLLALIRPGPGGGAKNRGHVDQMKQKAFVTVGAILAVLVMFLLAFVVTIAITESRVLTARVSCMITTSVICFSLPSSLVLPLLYLYKQGKLPSCSYGSGKKEMFPQ